MPQFDKRPEYEQAWQDWVAANPGKNPGEFKAPDAEGLSAYDRFVLTQPGGREQLIAQKEKDNADSNRTVSSFKGIAAAIPVFGGIASGLAGLALDPAEAARRKSIDAVKSSSNPDWDEFIAELQKPIDWNAPETKLLLSEARNSAMKSAVSRGLGTSGVGQAGAQQAVANAQARYGMQRQGLLANALASKQSGNISQQNLDLQKQAYANSQDANAQRNAIAIGGGLAQTGQQLYTNWNNSQSQGSTNNGLSMPQTATPQPFTQTNNVGNVPADRSYPTSSGLSTPEPTAGTRIGLDSDLRNA